MRKFLRNIAFFALPFLAGLIYLFAGPYDKEYGYNMVTKDCRTGNWIYRRLYESPHPVDVAFLGTSKTMCDVNDALLQERLANEAGLDVEVANFGICRKGENLHYLIARDLFEHKPPRYLFVEVSTHTAEKGHFHFPYLADAGDLAAAPIWVNQGYLSDMGDFAWNRFIYHRESTLGIERKFNDFLDNPQHSFMAVANDIAQDEGSMAAVAEKRKRELTTEIPEGLVGWWYRQSLKAPQHYYRKIVELAQAHGTQVFFLYLPVYGTPGNAPREMDFYQEFGPVLIPPDSVFTVPEWHMDDSHLNQVGAGKLSDWLTGSLKNILTGNLPAGQRVE